MTRRRYHQNDCHFQLVVSLQEYRNNSSVLCHFLNGCKHHCSRAKSQYKRRPFRSQVLIVSLLLDDLGHAVQCRCGHRRSQGRLQPLPGQHLGALRPRLPGLLHCQPGRLHDHQGGVLRPVRHTGLEGESPLWLWGRTDHLGVMSVYHELSGIQDWRVGHCYGFGGGQVISV